VNNPEALFTPIPFIRRSSAGQNCGKDCSKNLAQPQALGS
jgi:hypothetical protein